MKKTIVCLILAAAFISLAACSPKPAASEDMATHEFLCKFAPPSQRLRSESGYWYYLADWGQVYRWTPMEDIAESWVDEDVSFKLESLVTGDDAKIYLQYTLTNGMESTLDPLGRVEIAVLLEDGWYVMPNVPYGAFGEKLPAGEGRECVIELGTLDKSHLPDGHYRIQLKIDKMSYAYAEFDMENAAGEMHLRAE